MQITEKRLYDADKKGHGFFATKQEKLQILNQFFVDYADFFNNTGKFSKNHVDGDGLKSLLQYYVKGAPRSLFLENRPMENMFFWPAFYNITREDFDKMWENLYIAFEKVAFDRLELSEEERTIALPYIERKISFKHLPQSLREKLFPIENERNFGDGINFPKSKVYRSDVILKKFITKKEYDIFFNKFLRKNSR